MRPVAATNKDVGGFARIIGALARDSGSTSYTTADPDPSVDGDSVSSAARSPGPPRSRQFARLSTFALRDSLTIDCRYADPAEADRNAQGPFFVSFSFLFFFFFCFFLFCATMKRSADGPPDVWDVAGRC